MRWSKEKTVQERKGKEASIASSMAKQCLEHPGWASEAFKTRFSRWMNVRRAQGKKPKDWNVMFQEQLNWLDSFGEEIALSILSHSIMNNYQGLFPPKQGNNGQGAKSSKPQKFIDLT